LATAHPFAVLLTHFTDGDDQYDLDFYRRLFTSAGSGSGNLVDYFHEASNGRVDISGSRVFSGIALGKKSTEYKGSGVNQKGRQDLVTWAKTAATAANVALDQFSAVVVLTRPAADVFGSWGQAVLNPDTIGLGVAAHEMGHAFGLQHSGSETSIPDPYKDPFDIMSWANTWNGFHPDYGTGGPLANAANMRILGWLDESRVATFGIGSHEVAIRPLTREDLGGLIAAQVEQYVFEYRPNVGFDSAFPAPGGVLVHSGAGDRSILHFGTLGQSLLRTGDSFARGLPWMPYERKINVSILSMNPTEARLGIEVRPAISAPPAAGPGIVFGGVDVGAGGWVIVGGKVIPVPPREPILVMLEQLGLLTAADSVRDRELQRALRAHALDGIERAIGEERHLHG
jgi:hypothetical protein